MGILIRAVISGFGFSLGAALFRKVSKQIGLDDKDSDKAKEEATKPVPPPVAAPDRGDNELANAPS